MLGLNIWTSSIDGSLPEAIRRQMQVEELWARRAVLAELMNSDRLNLYASRRALLWPSLLSQTARL